MTPLAKVRSYLQHHPVRLAAAGLVALATAGWIWLSQGVPLQAVTSFATCAEQGYAISESNPPTCRADGRTFVGPLASAGPTLPDTVNQAFLLLVRGDLAQQAPREQVVINDQPTWERYWRDVHTGLASQPPLIPVDFKTSTVVAITDGTQDTDGYKLRVTSILSSDSGSVVYATEQLPTITCQVHQTPTNRYQIVKAAKLVEPVSFRFVTEHRKC